MSKQAIIDFLNELSEDPDLRREFQDDPESTAEGRDMTSEEVALLQSGDSDKIRLYLGPEMPFGFAKFINFGFAKKYPKV